jgi:uncharacterized protein with FMN-binding domain
MRRAILAITATIAGLVALLTFKSHAPTIPTATVGGTSNGVSSSPVSEAGPGSVVPTGQAGGLTAGESTITGQPANTVYGPVQVQLVVRAKKIVKVSILEQPDSTIHDIQIGQFAFPELISETLSAQSAKIDAVSGASYTSEGYIQSLQNALDHGL